MNKYTKSIIVFFSFFIYPMLMFVPFQLFGVSMSVLPNNIKAIYMFAFNVIFLGIILIIYNNKMIEYYYDFKKNGKQYISETIKYWYLGLFVMILSNLIINVFSPSEIAENEEAIRKLLGIIPLYMIFSTVIYAPLAEEIVCRQVVRDIFKNKWVFITMSALIFGSAHVVGSMSSAWNLLYIIPYGSLGAAFAYAFYKTNNLFTSIVLHALHNGILISLYLIIL